MSTEIPTHLGNRVRVLRGDHEGRTGTVIMLPSRRVMPVDPGGPQPPLTTEELATLLADAREALTQKAPT